MANWFEDVTKTLADEKIGRRTALRRVGGTIAGVALAGALPELALAASRHCPTGGGTCNGGYSNCVNNPNPNCFCFSDPHNKGVCGCSAFCSQLTACNSNHDCAKGSFCAISTCCFSPSPNVCSVKCKGKNKNCSLGAGHGASSAHR